MLYDPWLRVLMLAGLWLLLGGLLALGLVRWWRYQKRLEQRAAEARAREEQVMDLLRASRRPKRPM